MVLGGDTFDSAALPVCCAGFGVTPWTSAQALAKKLEAVTPDARPAADVASAPDAAPRADVAIVRLHSGFLN